jgi:uncharacterized protein (TIGR03067 family)
MEETMTKRLPARPSLEHLRSQAKSLLNQLTDGDPEAAAAFIENLPAARGMTAQRVPSAGFKLADAQSVVARQNRFSSWPALVRHVEQLRQMEGTWEFRDLEVDGNTMPKAALRSSRMLIDGDRFRMESPEAIYEGIFTIDVEQRPHRIDIEFVEGPEAGNWSYGIFEVNGDDFKLCLGLTGASRPTAFTTSPGSGHALENLHRVVKARPESVHGGTPQPRPEPSPFDVSEFEVEMTPLMVRLEGDWSPVQLVQNGQALPAMMLAMGTRSVAGNEAKVVFGGQVMVHVKVRVDETQSPIAVDYLNVGKLSSGQISRGVMQWIDDDVQFCMASPGAPRPTDFSCETGSGRTLSRWKRK